MAFSLSSLAFFILLLRFVLKARKSTVVSGVEEMIGMQIQVISKKGSTYKVLCHGEVWSAKSQDELLPNEISYVESISGLILALKK